MNLLESLYGLFKPKMFDPRGTPKKPQEPMWAVTRPDGSIEQVPAREFLKKQGKFVPEDPKPTKMPTKAPTKAPAKGPAKAQAGSVKGASTSNESIDFLERVVFPITDQYGIPRPVAAGQYAAEGRGLHKYGVAPYNNPYNINATDQNPDGAFRYGSQEDGVKAYAELLKRRYASALEAGDPLKALMRIQELGYAGDPQTYDARSPNDYKSYSDFVMNTPEWRQYLGQ